MSASKQKRSSSRTTSLASSSRITTAEYPILVESGGDGTESSFNISISPSRRTRQYEKDTLSNLNDRLAVYIDRVRQLELENERLNVRINESEVVEKKERHDLVARYEAKVKELRDLIDDALKEKTRVNMEAKSALAERDNLRARIGKLEKELKQSEKLRLSNDSLIQDLQARLNSADNMRRHLEDENKNLLAENEDLKQQLEILRKQVEDEALANTALHNQNQSLKEDYDFLKRTHEGQLEEIHRKRQVEMTTTAREIERTYESRLQEQLQAMRAEFDERLNKNRRDIDETYKNKLNEANEARQQMNLAKEEAARLRLRIHEVEKVGSGYESRIEGLNKKIADLESQLRFVRDDCDVRISQRDKRIAELQGEIDRLLTEYQDLFDLKVQLDTELKAYQNLLEGEESRLNISQQSSGGSPAVSPTAGDRFSLSYTDSGHRRAIKRKRFNASDDSLYYRNTAKSYKLVNKGEEIISIGQWAIKSIANDKETVYKFHSRQTMKPGDTITVWSADSGEKHTPPSQLVMKNQQWPAGDRVKTSLVDADGNEMATRESIAELQYGQFVSDDGQDPEQRCAVM
ncbi:intermediate filament protein [Onchocerca flexuosa]|uniref:Intermediate filament protein n=1 Tax=Onchocerca flexuosa TaxID=387005 RepID=A0A238C5X9_9BILA|nr:intermediate filament protein [Onchocerca flexuosa]